MVINTNGVEDSEFSKFAESSPRHYSPGFSFSTNFSKSSSHFLQNSPYSRTVPIPSGSVSGFCIGNGQSRASFDLDRLRPHGIIYGCNALFRDFEPDVLTAMDNGMLLEIRQSGYSGTMAYFNKTRKNAILEIGNTRQILFPVPPGAWYTGIASLWIMCSRHPELKRIFLMGFDFYDSKTNNIYKNSLNYKKMGLQNDIQFDSFRKLVFEKFDDKTFYRVGNVKDPFPEEWKGLANVEFMSYDEFEGLL